MLYLFFGKDDYAITDPDSFFEGYYEESWLDDDFVKQMVKAIDNTDILSPHCIQSPYLGQVPPTYLSGGVKGLICLYKMPVCLMDMTIFGENCEDWILKIADKKNIHLTSTTYDLHFKDKPIRGICENDNEPFDGFEEYRDKMLDYLSISRRSSKDFWGDFFEC